MPDIVVIGSSIMDLTAFTDRVPRAGETVIGSRFDLGFGGKGANQAVAARLCGARVSVVSRVGDDLFGEATIRNFEGFGVDASHVRVVPGRATGAAQILVEPGGQNRIVVTLGANDTLAAADVDAADPVIQQADCVLLQLEIPVETVYHAVRLAARHGVRCMLNPAPGRPLDLARIAPADYLIPNEIEAEALTGLPVRSVEEAATCARALVTRLAGRVIITLGDRGAIVATGEDVEHVPAFRVEAADTTGAGDAFVGAFAVFLAEGVSESDAIRRAGLYAALSTMRAGTQKSFVDRETFERAWRERAASPP